MIFGSKYLKAIASAFLLASLPVHTFATETAKAIPFKTTPTNAGGDPMQLIVGFAVCLLALVAIIYVLRRRQTSSRLLTGEKKQIRIAESQRLGPRSSLHVVEFSGKRYLIAQTEQNVSCIATVSMNEAIQEQQP